MISQPAIALLELNAIPVGAQVADAMVKRAPIDLLRVGTVQPGRYLILVGGAVAAVEESYVEGRRVAGEALTDQIMLPDVHEQVFRSVLGQRRVNDGDALGVIETSSLPATVLAADKAVKAADVVLVEIRLGNGLGGNGVLYLTGKVEAVQASIHAGVASVSDPGAGCRSVIIPSQHPELRECVQRSTSFFASMPDAASGG